MKATKSHGGCSPVCHSGGNLESFIDTNGPKH